MSKAGSSLLRTPLVRAADNARRQDPSWPASVYLQMTERGKDHHPQRAVANRRPASPIGPGPSCAAAPPYVIRDNDGRPVTAAQAKGIAGRWTVPAEVRARRRSRKKAGKAPTKSSKEDTHGATSPAPPLHPGASGPSSEAPDNRSPIGNQNKVP
jgi:hypothetical protein